MSHRCLLAMMALSTGSYSVSAQPFDGIVVFGDSHSDIGNFCKLLPDDPDCIGQRSSNGPLWIEHFATQLNLPPAIASLDGGLNFAFGGARTGHGSDSFSGIAIPRIGNQIDQYLEDNVPRENQLFILFAGHNDWNWNPEVDATIPLENVLAHITDLANAGVQHLIVPNLSPLGHAPFYRGGQSEASINAAIREYNQAFATALPTFAEGLDINITTVDFASLVEAAIKRPDEFGLSNVTARGNSRGVTNPDEYMYWDDIHFTAAFHNTLAAGAIAAMPKPSFTALAFGPSRALGETINTSTGDGAPSVSQDGLTMYFSRLGNGVDLYTAQRVSTTDDWGRANPIVELNTGSRDDGPSISTDGLELFFWGTRDDQHGIFVSKREDQQSPWGKPQHLSQLKTFEGRNLFPWSPAISPDGLSLYFAGVPGTSLEDAAEIDENDIYVASRDTLTTEWSPPRNLGPVVNSNNNDSDPGISPDGLSLFFTSCPTGWGGSCDIVVSRRESIDDDWQRPITLGPEVNSPAHVERHAAMSHDGSTLFFQRTAINGDGFDNTAWSSTDIYDSPVTTVPSEGTDISIHAPEVVVRPVDNPDGIRVHATPLHKSTNGIFFRGTATDGTDGLFRSNGTSIERISDLWIGSNGVTIRSYSVELNGSHYFNAIDTKTGQRGLYRMDSNGIDIDLVTPRFWKLDDPPIEFNDQLYFGGTEGLMRTTSDGAALVFPFGEPERVFGKTVFHGQLHFWTSGQPRELYRTDGVTIERTEIVGIDNDDLRRVVGVFNDEMYLLLDGGQAAGLYKTDGEIATRIAPVEPEGNLRTFVAADRLFFATRDGLFKTNGEDVTLVSESVSSDSLSFLSELAGDVYFESSSRVYKTDGEVVIALADLNVRGADAVFGSELFFGASNPVGDDGLGLYRTNGPTVDRLGFGPEDGKLIPDEMTEYAGQLLFTAGGTLYSITLAGDANEDGKVDFVDFLALAERFGQPGGWSDGDFDLNNTVDFADFLKLSINFGADTTPQAATLVPEPRGFANSAALQIALLLAIHYCKRATIMPAPANRR